MIKLSELKNEDKIIDENSNIYTVEEVKNDLRYFTDREKKLYTTTEYHASIDARTVLENSFESEYENNMYEDWIDSILGDITDEDVEKVQIVIDGILSRNKSQNIAYYEGERIVIDN